MSKNAAEVKAASLLLNTAKASCTVLSTTDRAVMHICLCIHAHGVSLLFHLVTSAGSDCFDGLWVLSKEFSHGTGIFAVEPRDYGQGCLP